MPVDYQYDPKANIVHALPYAELSIAEIRGFFEALIQDDAVAFGSIEVVHFEKVDDFMFTSVEAQGIISALDRGCVKTQISNLRVAKCGQITREIGG